jgi:sugar lactone lactonase YvrE
VSKTVFSPFSGLSEFAALPRLVLLLGFLAFLLVVPEVHSQQAVRFPGTTPVGMDATAQSVTLTMTHNGVLDSVKVMTQGSEHFDFADLGGGTCAKGSSYLAGQSCTVNLGFHPYFPGERRGAIVMLDTASTALAIRLVAGSATGAVGTFVPGTISTVAGSQAWIYGGDGTPATQTSIFLPFGFAVDAAGNLFIADSSNDRIRKVDAKTKIVTTIAGNGIIGATGDGGPAIGATISNPSSIALDAAGNLYFSDSGNNGVRRIDAFTGNISTVAGILGSHGYTGDSGPAILATLNTPNGLAFDAAGNLYIADTGNHVIRLVNAATGLITTVAGRGGPDFYGDGGPASAAALASPWSITVAPSGELYIADQNNHRIRKIDNFGIISTVVGNGKPGFSGDQKVATSAQLDVPASVAIDVAGNIYVADSGNNRVRKVNAQTNIITTIAGNSTESFTGDSGPADQAGLYGPYTLALDGQDNLFIADVFHNRIRKISSNAATLEFPPIRVGRVSAPLTQAIENDGNAPMTLSSILSITNSQLDPATTLCATSVVLAPLDKCVIGVKFAPTITGDPVLGTVNVASDAGNSPGVLYLSGQVLDIDPTTLTLASSLNPGTTGTPITFSVTAISAGSTPTGAMTFLDGATPMGTVQLQAGGNVSFTTSSLSGGQHSITASYAGDSSNAAAVSAALIEIVKDTQTPTATTLTSSLNPLDAGAPVQLTATVDVKALGSGTAAVAGTVTFLDGGTVLGTATINGSSATIDRGSATLKATTLSVGNHNIIASYAGTPADGSSSSTPLVQVVRIATTNMVLTTATNPSISGAPLALSATIVSTGGTPTGNIIFSDGSRTLGTTPLNGQGVATLLVNGPAWTPGTHTLTAAYVGDSLDSPSTSPAVAQVVNLAKTTVTLGSSLNPAGLGAQVTFTAGVTTNGGSPSGSLQFYDGTILLGTVDINALGTEVFSTSSLALGSHPITAVYIGDTYDSAATSNIVTQVVQPATVTNLLSSSKTPTLFGEPVVFTVNLTGTGSKPMGTVTFNDGATVLTTLPLDSSGVVTFTTTTLTIGAHTVTATYNGDTNHAITTSAAITQNVLQVTATTLISSSSHAIAGVPVTFRANVVGASGKPVTGLVTFTDGATALTSVAPDSTGLASYTINLPVGAHSVVASYGGDQQDATSVSTSAPVLVDIAITTTTLISSTNPVLAGAPLTFTATVTGNGGAPTGTVTFQDGTGILTTVPLSSNGVATLTLSNLSPGIHSVSARYSGDPFDQTSTSPVIAQQIVLKTTIGVTSNANPSLLLDNVTFTVVVGNGVPSMPPTGSVTLFINGNVFAQAPLVSGTVTFIVPKPALGINSVTAIYSGDSQNDPAEFKTLLQNVTLRPSTVSFTSSATILSAGQQLIMVSVVQGVGPFAPTGTVTFQSGGTIIGSAPINAAGVATLTLAPDQGVYNAVSHYLGDSLYSPSTSPAVGITVGPTVEFVVAATPPNITVQSGQHTMLGLVLTSAPTFKDTLAFGCAGLPAYTTCTFSTNQIAVNGGGPKSLNVTVDTGNPLGAGALAGLNVTSGPLLCLLPGGFLLTLLMRRRKRLVRGLTLLAVLLILGASAGLSGCASNFAQSQTAAGDYTFQIVGTGNVTGATQTTIIHMSVTK